MKRRAFLVAAGASAALAGCVDELGPISLPASDPNPWRTDTLVVGLRQEVAARHDIHAIVEEALEYWTEHAETFAGYPIAFDYRPNADDPDIRIILVAEITECGEHSGEIAGCAPLVGDRAPDTAEVRIVDGYRADWMVTTLKHEIGHTLGLGHDDEPAHIMSNEIEDRIPDYHARREAEERFSASFEPYATGVDHWNEAMDHWPDDHAATEAAALEARDAWAGAAASVDDAAAIAADLGEDEATALLVESHSHVDHLRQAAEAAVEMARAADRGDLEESNAYGDQANEHRDTAYTYEFASHRDVLLALGFAVRE